jgi:acyl-CoA thioester hydrolase
MNDTPLPPGEPTYRGIVYPWHCDHMGHMNVMWYVGKFDEATWALMARAGLTTAYFRQAARGMAAVEQQIVYQRELLAGDAVSIFSEFLELKDKSVRFRHVMVRDSDGIVAAQTSLTGVHIDTGARKAAAFDPAIRARIDVWLSKKANG